MSFTTLIGPEQLIAGVPDAIVIDVRFDLAAPEAGEAAWRAGHVPGSRYLSLDRDLSGAKTGRNGRHPLPTREAFAATLGRCGIEPTSPVIALDAQGGIYAARLWWMLRWMGHANVAVLDGGFDAWRAAGGVPTTDATPAPAAAPPYPFATLTPLAASIDTDALAARLGRGPLLDARAGERFRGEVEPLDRAAGHIPGALNRFYKDNLDSATGRFLPADALRAAFTPLLGSQPASALVHQCGSGVTACHNLLAMEHAGLSGSILYPGSWSEWSADPSRPIAQGA